MIHDMRITSNIIFWNSNCAGVFLQMEFKFCPGLLCNTNFSSSSSYLTLSLSLNCNLIKHENLKFSNLLGKQNWFELFSWEVNFIEKPGV